MNVFRNILAVVSGLLAGAAINMFIVVLGPHIIAAPAGVDVTTPASIAASIHLFEAKHFITPFLAHALGTMMGAALAFGIAKSHKLIIGYSLGGVFLAGGIAASLMIPAPVWFIVLDLTTAYIPMAWLGIYLSNKMKLFSRA